MGKLQRALTEKDTKAVASIILTKNKVNLFAFDCQRDIISFSFGLTTVLADKTHPFNSEEFYHVCFTTFRRKLTSLLQRTSDLTRWSSWMKSTRNAKEI